MKQPLSTRQSFPGTVHYINPKLIPEDSDEVLISTFGRLVRWIGVAASLYVAVVAINLIMDGIAGLGFSNLTSLMEKASNPLLCLMVGIVATFVVQSSTVITTITVAAVGGGLVSIDSAAMLIMGANIGTCFTALLVAYGYFSKQDEFPRALSAALTHWCFNVLSVVAFFPIELAFHPLTALSGWLSRSVLGGASVSLPTGGLVSWSVSPLVDALGTQGLSGYIGTPLVGASVCVLAGILLIAAAVQLLTIMLRTLMAFPSHVLLERSASPTTSLYREFGLGLGLTLLTHSSSATTCATVPFAGAGTISTRGALGVAVGANVATTLSAVVAAFAVPGALGSLALQAAFIHVLFNLFGALAVLLIRPVATANVRISDALARLSARARLLSLGVWTASYIALPLAVIALLGW